MSTRNTSDSFWVWRHARVANQPDFCQGPHVHRDTACLGYCLVATIALWSLTRGTILTGVDGAPLNDPLLLLRSAMTCIRPAAASGGGREGLANGDTRPSNSDWAAHTYTVAQHTMTGPGVEYRTRHHAPYGPVSASRSDGLCGSHPLPSRRGPASARHRAVRNNFIESLNAESRPQRC